MNELGFKVSKYNHKNTLGAYSQVPCPVPRKSNFKNLQYLNGTLITKLDIMRVSGKDDMKDILLDDKET